MARKIDLKTMLNAIDKNDTEFYNNLTPEQEKEFSAWLAMRWASSVSGRYSDHYLVMTHEIVNKNFSELSKHPVLLWKLLAIIGIGKPQRHTWVKPGKTGKKNKVQVFLRELYPLLKESDLELMQEINTIDELKELAVDNGYQKDEIKNIFK